MEQQVHQYARLGPGAYQVPIARAIDLVAGDPSLLQPIAIAVPAGGGAMTPAQRGDLIFNKLQPCATCHSVDGTPRIGPTVKGLFGSRVTLVDGRIVVADEAFLRESILSPLSTVVQGFPPAMPPVPLKPEEVDALVEYLKTIR
jgi:cytochrome c oxidase subunit 2